MTFLIACLLIYGFDFSPWLYAIALLGWLAKAFFDERRASSHEALIKSVEREIRNSDRELARLSSEVADLRLKVEYETRLR